MMRKLEEMMIVWLIENNRLVTKERMYETYLNIIEWGPNIYGAEEAAKFYFDKSCDDLSPAEAIFMASIIPRPKKFKWSFNEDGTLKEYHTNYYEVVGGRLHKHGYISDREFRKLKPEVELKGKAKDYFPDLSEKEEMPSVIKNFFNIFKRKK
jgi:membrane peptidoglycan carboxypeptidase